MQGIPSEIDSLFDRNVNNLIILENTMDEVTQDKLAFEDVTKLRRSYLLLDMTPKTDDKLRVRVKISNDVSYPQVVYIPLRNNINTCHVINHVSFM